MCGCRGYVINEIEENGSNFCCVCAVFPDPPGKPGKPEVVDYDKDQAEIKWTPSKSDGGNPIQKYVIEKKAKGGDWEKVTN